MCAKHKYHFISITFYPSSALLRPNLTNWRFQRQKINQKNFFPKNFGQKNFFSQNFGEKIFFPKFFSPVFPRTIWHQNESNTSECCQNMYSLDIWTLNYVDNTSTNQQIDPLSTELIFTKKMMFSTEIVGFP